MKKIDISLRHIGTGRGRFKLTTRSAFPKEGQIHVNLQIWKWVLVIRNHTPGWKRPFWDLKFGQAQLRNRRETLAEFAIGTGTWWITTDIEFGRYGKFYGPFDSELQALTHHDGSTFQVRKGVYLCSICGYALGPTSYCMVCNTTPRERSNDTH